MATVKELVDQKISLVAEADALQKRYTELTPEEEAKLEENITQAEALDADIVKADREERLVQQRASLERPSRPAPQINHALVKRRGEPTDAEGLQLWVQSFMGGSRSADAHYRATTAGFQLGQTKIEVPCDYGSLNLHKRILSKGGVHLGQELMPVTYSDKVVEYISYFSPILTALDSETTADGNDRDYFVLDDTGNISTYTTDAGGTEISPNIPDKDAATDVKISRVYQITSGYQKITNQAAQDSAVNLMSKVAQWNGQRHSRRMERDVILGNGVGTPEGILDTSTDIGPVAAWDLSAIETLFFAMPSVYRQSSVFLCSPGTTASLRIALKDLSARSYFDRTIEQNIEFDVLFGRKFFESEWMPDDTLVFFNPNFYTLRLVAGQTFSVLVEKFFPHVAYCGLMRFGGLWLGPSTANIMLTRTVSSS